MLERLGQLYLGGQSMAEFVANGGDIEDYAAAVFAGEIFGAGTDPADASVNVWDMDTLAEGLDDLAASEGIVTAYVLEHEGRLSTEAGVLERLPATGEDLAWGVYNVEDATRWLTAHGYRQLTDWQGAVTGHRSLWIEEGNK